MSDVIYTAIIVGGCGSLAISTVVAVAAALLNRKRRRLEQILAARKAERAATLQHIADVDPAAIRGTFDALVADVTASDYGYGPGDLDTWSDYFAGAPIFDRLCADVARREAAELDVEWEREAGA